MADNIRMAREGTQFSDATISLAWAEGRDESEVIAVPPASRSSKLLDAMNAGVVEETDDPVTVYPDPPAATTFVRVEGEPEDGQAPIYDADEGVWKPDTAGTNVSGPEDVPGLEEALEEKADATAIVRKIDASLLTATGDMIYRPGAVNYATAGQGASASGGGNVFSPANVIDGNDSTYFGTFNFQSSAIVIDLGQVRAIGGFRAKLIGGSSTGVVVNSGTSSTGPWTHVKTQTKDGANVAQGDLDNVVDSRYWQFVALNHDGMEVDWYTIEVTAAAVPARLPIGTTGQILKVVNGVPTWSDP